MLIDEFGLSLGEVAERVGKSKPTVSNRIRLLELPEDVLAMIAPPRADRGPRARRARRARTRTAAAGSRSGSSREGMSVRAAERAARWAGARTKERRATTVDPALAGAGQGRGQAPDGFEAKVGSAGLHVPVDSEVQLEELAEALERLGDP